MKTLLWLDDYRDPNAGYNDKDRWIVFSPIPQPFNVVWVKNYPEFVTWILLNGLPDAICFDHDLADGHYHKNLQQGNINYSGESFGDDYNKTGYHCAKWLVDYCIDKLKPLPLYNIQSANPVGKDNINKLLQNYLKHWESL